MFGYERVVKWVEIESRQGHWDVRGGERGRHHGRRRQQRAGRLQESPLFGALFGCPSDSASLTATWLSHPLAELTPPPQHHVCSLPEDVHAWNPATYPDYDTLRSKRMAGKAYKDPATNAMQTSVTVRSRLCACKRPIPSACSSSKWQFLHDTITTEQREQREVDGKVAGAHEALHLRWERYAGALHTLCKHLPDASLHTREVISVWSGVVCRRAYLTGSKTGRTTFDQHVSVVRTPSHPHLSGWVESPPLYPICQWLLEIPRRVVSAQRVDHRARHEMNCTYD